ncbi:tubulin epsilon and delta complex protein 2 isoform X4 [Camelus dromedarius]|uniref:tubulin epsilon and delta complex protein 2 isoform X4 n=1 Tax=Camelus dromedarius TaxID=9838 RepID=UPI00311A5C00
MLPADCSRRLVAELRDALDSCAQRQRQLERSLRVSRRLLRAWEPAETPVPEPTPGPETDEKVPSSAFTACSPSPQDLKELELLTQVLEKAVRVRKGISKAGGDKDPSVKSESLAASPATRASTRLRASGWTGSHASETKPPRGIRQTRVPAKDLSERRLVSVENPTSMGRGARAAKVEPRHRSQQIVPLAAPQAREVFTLKDKGILLQLPMAFRKAASQNSRLWAQLSSTHTSDSGDAATTAKNHFLQKMQTTSGWPSSRLSPAEVEAEVGRLRKACSLLRLRMGKELTAAVVEQQLGPWPEGRLPRASSPCGGGADTIRSPPLLLYSSTQELQTLAALRLRVAMLNQQIHLEKVLMAELLPLVREQEPLGPPWLALCRAVHSLLCEGGERFLTILREDEPAD